VKLAAGLTLLVGCGHGEPFDVSRPEQQPGPFQDAVPLRLTFNLGFDSWPSWSADGSALWYSAELATSDLDRCIARLPARGGTRAEIQCPLEAANGFSEGLEQPASDGSRLAWARSEVDTAQLGPYRFTLWVAPLAARATPTLVQTFPYQAPSGRPHDAPLYLQWLRPGVLLYLGAENGCCGSDTLRFGEQVVLLDLTGPTPSRSFVPGTTRASAVARSEDGLAIYYTLYGDSRVYRQVLATGEVTVLYDFGAGHIARDPDVSGTRLVAVIDGKPDSQAITPFGLVQVDHGGDLMVVDLTTGVGTRVLDAERWYKHPRFAPGGTRLVAEGWPFTIVSTPIGGGVFRIDTVLARSDDLWIREE